SVARDVGASIGDTSDRAAVDDTEAARQRRLLLEAIKEGGLVPSAIERLPRRQEAAWAPLSFGQRRLWFLAELQPRSPAYNVPEAVRIEGSLHVEALRRALGGVVRR